MGNAVVTAGLGHVNSLGVTFMVYAQRYHDAGSCLVRQQRSVLGFDPVPYQLFCQSLELHLKSFIWLSNGVSLNDFQCKYRHKLKKLWKASKDRGIGKFAAVTPLRDETIELVAPYYEKRQFTYLDISMVFRGYKELGHYPRSLSVLARLTGQLNKTLQNPILEAAQSNPHSP